MSDPEIEAMTAVADALRDLEEDTQGRVLRWAAERHRVTLGIPAPRNGLSETPESATTLDDISDEEISAESPKFEHFAELYHAANPKVDVDRALVAGYWFQAIREQPSFQAAQLNKELKHLGHALKHVTAALDGNQSKKPARIIQLRKSGSSRQARKTYKLTHEGLVYVQGMIAS
ncbi:hypothetical protein [Streptomyces albidoflavus]|uniref:hypothetical protein n=1 Tax=Streptomyces albidoflavus TaxID=1886 RepID=UPI000F50F677|nr:hypothetical protein [Streptomyces albidoflavus]